MPTDQRLFDTQAFVEMLNDELIEIIVPTITGCREDYFIRKEDIPIVADQYGYRLPTRAVGMKVDDVQLIDPNTAGNPNAFTPLARISPTNRDTGIAGWYFENNKINILDPNSNTNKSLRVYYECRPGYLINEIEAGKITAINTGTNQVTLATVNATWVSGTTLYDFIQNNPPFDTLAYDQSATIAGLILTFTSLPSDLRIGNYVAEATCSPIAQIPLEFQNLLCQGTAIKCLEAINLNSQIAVAKYMQMEQKAIAQITPRANKSPKYLVNRQSLIFDNYSNIYV
jgi:hypothetical protein